MSDETSSTDNKPEECGETGSSCSQYAEQNGDLNLLDFEKAIAEFVEKCSQSGEPNLSSALSSFLTKLSFYVCSLNTKMSTVTTSFDVLATQVSAMSDTLGSRLDCLDLKVNRALERLGVKQADIARLGGKPKGNSEGKPVASSQPSNEAGNAPSSKSGRKKQEFDRKVEETESKFPNTLFVFAHAQSDPLSPMMDFPFRVGSLTFNSFEQAYHYIRCMFHENYEKAAKVKAAASPNEAGTFGANFSTVTSDAWKEAREDILYALFSTRAEQNEAFAQKLRDESTGNKEIVLVAMDKELGTGMSKAATLKSAPKFTGENIYGKVLHEFAEAFTNAKIEKESLFDVGKYCHPDLGVDVEKKILVLADCQLDGFAGSHQTKLVYVRSLQAVRAKLASNNIRHQLDLLDLKEFGAIILIFGAYEVGRSPEDIEKDYVELFEYVVNSFQGPIYVSNSLPRTDKFSESLKLANYAVSIAARKFEERIQLLDLHERFTKLPMWKTLLKMNGFQLNEAGGRRLAEFLADLVPFANLIPPKDKLSPPKAAREAPRGGGPPKKRGRLASSSSPGIGRLSGFGRGSRVSRPSFGGNMGVGGATQGMNEPGGGWPSGGYDNRPNPWNGSSSLWTPSRVGGGTFGNQGRFDY